MVLIGLARLTTRTLIRTSALQIAIVLEGDLVDAFDMWFKILGISGSTPLRLATAQVPEDANAPQSSSSLMKANPVGLNSDILIRILEEAP
jgi:hypothetical protein